MSVANKGMNSLEIQAEHVRCSTERLLDRPLNVAVMTGAGGLLPVVLLHGAGVQPLAALRSAGGRGEAQARHQVVLRPCTRRHHLLYRTLKFSKEFIYTPLI